MLRTLDDALKDDLITVLSRDDSLGIYEIRIGDLETVVTIELGRFLDSERTKYRTSHAIKTPSQAGPYWTSIPYGDDPSHALHRAIRGLTDYYRDGVKDGHRPREDWLVE